MKKLLTQNQVDLLSSLLIFCEKNHPYYQKEARGLWYYLFNPQGLLPLEFDIEENRPQESAPSSAKAPLGERKTSAI